MKQIPKLKRERCEVVLVSDRMPEVAAETEANVWLLVWEVPVHGWLAFCLAVCANVQHLGSTSMHDRENMLTTWQLGESAGGGEEGERERDQHTL